MTIHKSWLAFLLLQLFGFSTYAAQQTDCTPLEFATFIAAAQSLDQSADSKGRRMMTCSRRDYRESAMYWLSFFHGMMERKTSLASISPLIAAESVGPGEKEFAIREALLGRVQVLSSRVASQTLGYADDPYVLLTLARTVHDDGKLPWRPGRIRRAPPHANADRAGLRGDRTPIRVHLRPRILKLLAQKSSHCKDIPLALI